MATHCRAAHWAAKDGRIDASASTVDALTGGLSMNNAVAMVLVAALFGAGGQLSLKIGMGQVGRIGTDSLEQPLQIVVRVLTTPFVVGGLGLYVLGAVLWLAILSREQLSFAYPILAVGYAITPTLAWLMLGESVNPLRWLGIATICMGVLLTARS